MRHVGDQVSIDHPKYPGVWIIKSMGPVNAVVEPAEGGRGLRVPHAMLLFPGAAPTVVPNIHYVPGELVRIVEGRFAGLYVVIADKNGDKVNLARLGGDGGRYVRSVRRGLVKIDPRDVLQEGVV